jgi:hypothetical protein
VVTKTFSGKVSAQSEPEETITITVTKPDGEKDVFTTTTDADGAFTTTRDYPAGKGYSVVFHVDADADYTAADSEVISFDVEPTPRTITGSVT